MAKSYNYDVLWGTGVFLFFFFFWLCLVILVSGFSLVAGRAQALGYTGSVVVAWGLLPAACGILVP